ncbi:hypothetical protein UFOVP587_50 [uncultured Caudovirales phage]|uniref:Uncharacterized protein n=1 Tax=uncultured Caudovirales phage TaxID=2100421 RepID=A0A6J5N8S7_9CAUD|nr:hypothetical protein UFOVP587_50 [uncultured Caudovirales phage]
MAVVRSPFSAVPKPKSDTPVNPIADSMARGRALLSGLSPAGTSSTGGKGLNTSGSNKTKTSFGEEQQKLNNAYSGALAKIATSSLKPADKKKAINTLNQTYKTGATPVSPKTHKGLIGLVGGAVGEVLGAGGKAVMSTLDATQTVSRFAQSGLKEIGDMANMYVQSGSGVKLKGSQRASWSDFMKQGRDKDFRLAPQTGVKWLDSTIDFAADMALDPTTYIGVGEVGLIGKAGRAELAIKMGTEKMLLKHPQLIGKMDDIVRYGAAAIPKEVRAAEGINFGVRFMGTVVPKTEALAQIVSGKAGVGTMLRAGTGDLIDKIGVTKAARQFMTPSSRAGMVAKSLGRRQGLSDQTVIEEVAHYTSARWGKGATAMSYRKSTAAAKEILSDLSKSKADGVLIGKLIEDPVLRAAASVEDRAFAERIMAWQAGPNGRGGVNIAIDRFNADFGGHMAQVGFIEDYLHHRMTEDALKYAYGSKAGKAFFKDADLAAADLGSNSGAAMFRKYKKGEKFMGEVLNSGTIDEINTVFKRVAKVDYNFFENDIATIMDNYAYSMAKARGREAYTRRLMDYGSNVARIINQDMVPDKNLVAKLTASHGSLMGLRKDIVTAVNKGVFKAGTTAKETVEWAQKVMEHPYAKMGVIDDEVGLVQAKIARIEAQLADAHTSAAQQTVEQRGTFASVHKALLEEVQTLKTSIANGEMYQQAAYTKLRELYVQMYPNSQRIPKNVDALIDKVARFEGMSPKNTAQVRELTTRLKAVQQQIADTPPNAGELLNDLFDTEVHLAEQLKGFEVLGEVKAAADYSEDGFIYATYDDLVPRQFDPNADPMSRVVSTRPISQGGADMSTDEMAAIHKGFMEDGRSVMAHAIPTDAVHDLRLPETFYDFWDPQNGVGEAVGYALQQSGVDANGVFMSAWNDVLESGATDPMFADIYPALDDLMTVVGSMHAHKFELGVVDDDFLVQAFDAVHENFALVAGEMGLENSDMVAAQMQSDFLRAMTEEGLGKTGQPLLLPSQVVYGMDNPMADGAYSMLLPDNYSYTKQYGKDAVDNTLVDGTTSPVFRTTDELSQSVANSDYVSAELGAIEKMDAVAQAGRQTQDMISAREIARTESKSIGGQIGVVKREASRRQREAAQAYKDFMDFGTVNIYSNGKKITVPREKAIAILNVKEAKVNRLVADLEVRLGNVGVKDIERLRIKKLVQEERLGTLFNQRKVLERWTTETGVAMEADINLLRQAIAMEPAAGAAGTASRQWADSVRDRINAIANLNDTPVAKSWEKVVKQLHADEAQLAFLDNYIVPLSDAQLTQALTGAVGGTLQENITKGWERLGEGLGVEVTKDFFDIARPSMAKLIKKAEQGRVAHAISSYHALFKTYATMSLGFITRNAISSTFMNYVAGVGVGNIQEGVRAMNALAKHGPERWLDELGIFDPAIREIYETALKAVDATGRGITSEIGMQPLLKGSRASKIYNAMADNPLTRASGRGNDFVERAARFPMALDTMKRGLSYDEAINRVTRYHFDYSDLSKLDEKARALVPFWIWTTRNIPLQMTEQIYRPKAYIQYENLRQRNPVGLDIMMPKYLQEANPMGVGGNWLLSPDLPQTRIKQTAAQFASPSRLIGMMYPELKAIPEVIARKQLALDIPYTDKYNEAKGLDRLVAEVLQFTGGGSAKNPFTRVNAEGKLELDPAVSGTLSSAIPLLAKLQRLSGGRFGGKPTYDERLISSWMSEVGVPVKAVGERAQRGEAINRQFKIADLIKELSRQGYIQK